MNHILNSLHDLIDLKMAFAGAIFFIITLSNFADFVKIIGGIILIGYYVRRWILMEKNYKKQKPTDDENPS